MDMLEVMMRKICKIMKSKSKKQKQIQNMNLWWK